MITLMEKLNDITNVRREKVWAQAMLLACDVTSKSVTTSTEEGKSQYELLFGTDLFLIIYDLLER